MCWSVGVHVKLYKFQSFALLNYCKYYLKVIFVHHKKQIVVVTKNNKHYQQELSLSCQDNLIKKTVAVRRLEPEVIRTDPQDAGSVSNSDFGLGGPSGQNPITVNSITTVILTSCGIIKNKPILLLIMSAAIAQSL